MVAGSHCYTGRLVPKAEDHLDKKEGATLLTADHGGSSTVLLWLLFAMLSIEGGWPAYSNRTDTLWILYQRIKHIHRIFTAP